MITARPGQYGAGSKTYYNPRTSEVLLCGYVGFDDISKLRRFCQSSPALTTVTEAYQLGVASGVKWEDGFEDLGDSIMISERDSTDLDLKFGMSTWQPSTP